MACKTGAPEGELPPSQCPVCLEGWDDEDHLPKFLSCHHSVCVGCVGRLQRCDNVETPTRRPGQSPSTPTRRQGQSPSTPTSPLARFLTGRAAQTAPQEPLEGPETVPRVRCPLCRAPTPLTDPHTLQTNFYLRGLIRPPSLPRLVLWCESCSTVAAPNCTTHNLLPLPEKLNKLQTELGKVCGASQEWCDGMRVKCGREVEVYRWVCGLLRHAHGRVLSALSQAQQHHHALATHTQYAQSMVCRGEEGVRRQEPVEEVVAELTTATTEVKARQEALKKELNDLTLTTSFTLNPPPSPPNGYCRTRIALQAANTFTLTFSGDEDIAAENEGTSKGRSVSLRDLQERRAANQVRRSRSCQQMRPRTPQERAAAAERKRNMPSRSQGPEEVVRDVAVDVVEDPLTEDNKFTSLHRRAPTHPAQDTCHQTPPEEHIVSEKLQQNVPKTIIKYDRNVPNSMMRYDRECRNDESGGGRNRQRQRRERYPRQEEEEPPPPRRRKPRRCSIM